MPELHDLEVLIDSRTPIIVVESREETRIVAIFRRLSRRLPRPFFAWTVTEGLRPLGVEATGPEASREPAGVLVEIKTSRTPGVYLLVDFHPFLDDPVHVRLLKDVALRQHEVNQTVVLLAHAVPIPPELERHCARLEMSVPDREQLRAIVLDETRRYSRARGGQNVRTSRRMLAALIENLRGLPAAEARRLAGAAVQDGTLDDGDLPPVMQAKFELLNQDSVLSYEHDVGRLEEIGGLASLKRWLEIRAPVFTGASAPPGLDPPRGVLLLGVQGCGKSLAAKAVAGSWRVPLLRLDLGSLFDKFHGETERNLRQALETAELMAPCALWIDEIEKGLGADGLDGGTSRRVLATLLTWMAERRHRVFIVATANDIEALPPELMRKGRMDEIFFVDLPDAPTRAAILAIHLARRAVDGAIDIPRLAAACEGFSGSELEQLVVAALYTTHARGAPLTTEVLLEESARTRPLSVVMAEQVARLRAWAATRTVQAN